MIGKVHKLELFINLSIIGSQEGKKRDEYLLPRQLCNVDIRERYEV